MVLLSRPNRIRMFTLLDFVALFAAVVMAFRLHGTSPATITEKDGEKRIEINGTWIGWSLIIFVCALSFAFRTVWLQMSPDQIFK